MAAFMSSDFQLLYRAIAEQIANQIEAGLYREGERLPSVRALAKTHEVSATTAARVLIELEQNGFVEARARSGFYVASRTRAGNTPSATRTAPIPASAKVNELIGRIFRATISTGAARPVMTLGAAELDEALLPHKELAVAVARAVREGGASLLAYGHRNGDPDLRRRIVHILALRGVSLVPDDIVVTTGESEALGLALMALTSPDSAVAVESPCFFGILQWIETLGLRAVEIATDPHRGIDIDELERIAEATPLAALALNPTFHNPFGFAMPPEAMRRLMSVVERHRLPVIEDDVYGELHHSGRVRSPLKSFDREGWVFYCSSFSKTLAPGFRIGWCVPGRFGENLERVRAPCNAGVTTLTQRALAVYLDGRAYRRHLDGLRRLFGAQASAIRKLVLESFPIGTLISEPGGGFVFWVEIPAPFDVMRFSELALAEGISIAPGPIFSASGGFDNAFRLSVGRRLTPDVDAAIRSLGRIAVEMKTGR
jgi:DNA-binding transcriptional MocR family regulator